MQFFASIHSGCVTLPDGRGSDQKPLIDLQPAEFDFKFAKNHYNNHMNLIKLKDKARSPIGLTLLAGIVLLLLVRCLPFSHKKVPLGQPVVTATAKTMNVPVYLPALGTVTPIYNITVKTQINGQLMQVYFKEGQMVKAGDLIAEIDPRPYQAQLLQYEGQLAHDLATLANDKINLTRYQVLWHQDSVSKQTLDNQVALVKQDEGTIKLDEGLIATTNVNLMYTRITSPINGLIGLLNIDPGNFVQTSDTTGIAVINSVNPIQVVFILPEDNVQQVLQQMRASTTPLLVKAYDRDQNKLLAVGKLKSLDSQIDTTTGTVKLKALFANDDLRLFPNQFVNIQLLITVLQHATVIPTAAIQYATQDPQSSFVYLLSPDKTKVSVQKIKMGYSTDENTTLISGVLPGQSVVTEGADKLTDGTLVTVANATSPSTQALAQAHPPSRWRLKV